MSKGRKKVALKFNMSHIAQNLKIVKDRIQTACSKRIPELQYFEPRLVAVSKTKPVELVIEAYKAGQRHFGENYVNELTEKAHDEELLSVCPDIKWHFIGHLQRNKVNKVLNVPNLYIIETVDSEKIASALNTGLENSSKEGKDINIYVQVNTSGEKEKSGCKPEEASALVKYIKDSCPHLKVLGLMTIGIYDNYDPVEGINPDFKALIDCRAKVCEEFNINVKDFELSMGMSADFEHAIEVGSTNVRVGTSIFGARDYSKKE